MKITIQYFDTCDLSYSIENIYLLTKENLEEIKDRLVVVYDYELERLPIDSTILFSVNDGSWEIGEDTRAVLVLLPPGASYEPDDAPPSHLIQIIDVFL